jgi:hypothetical protein
MNTLIQRSPWYREPWPWILITGPLVVVIAGLTTAWIAYTRGDTVISEDYYRQGLAVQQTLVSSDNARAHGLTAGVKMTADGNVRLSLAARDRDFVPPAAIRMTLSHPTRAGLDQTAVLQRGVNGYAGQLHLPQSGHWLLLIESSGTETDGWRILGKVILPAIEVKIDASAS